MKKIKRKQKNNHTFCPSRAFHLLLAILMGVNVSARSVSVPQVLDTKVSVSVEEETVESLLKKIESVSEISFVYSKSKVSLVDKISRTYVDKSIKFILTDALPQDVSFGTAQNTVILKKKKQTAPKKVMSFQANGRATGTITDKNGNFLPYATVIALGTRRGTTSDIDGTYSLELPEGSYTLQAKYIGYMDAEIPVTIAGDSTVSANIVLKENATALEETVVYGNLSRGQAKALNEQKNAENFKNVVSYEQFSKYADRNAAEALQRIPGIALSRDQGEGELVSIRGLSPRFNAVQVNGSRIPSPDPDTDRAVGLDLLQADLMESIVVNKTLTPEMDGDAIGGTVNFNLKQAPDKPILNVSASGGFNQQQSEFEDLGKDLQSFSAVLGKRFFNDKLGLIAAGSYYRTNRGSLLNQYLYTDETSLNIEEKRNNDYDVRRVRYGLMFSPDIRFDKKNSLKLLANYNVYDDDEIRRLVDYLVTDGEESRETRNRGEYQKHALYQLSGDHDLSAMDISYRFSYTEAEEEMPYRTYWRFGRDVDYSGLSNDELTNLGVKDNPDTDSQLFLNRVRFDNNLTEDKNYEGRLDIEFPFELIGMENKLKVGGKFRNKNRISDAKRSQLDVDEDVNPFPINGGDFGFINIRANDPEASQVGGLDDFVVDEDRGDGTDYEAEENAVAAYVKLSLGLTEKLSLVTGVRFESTNNKYSAIRADDFNTVNEFTYSNLLPSAQFKYNFDDNTLMRLAYSSGFTRPPFSALIPGPDNIDRDSRRITRRNPELEPSTVNNFDFIFEKYSNNLGVFTVGLFGKFVDNQIQTQRSFTDFEGDLYTVFQSINGENAKAMGVEVSLVHKFLNDGVPFLKWFGVSTNYTYAYTEQKISTIVDDEVVNRTLPFESPKNIFNLGLFYENPKIGLTFTASGVYRDAILIDLGDNELTDFYFGDEFHLDISASQRITKKLSAFVQVNNITDQDEREFFGDPNEDFSRIHQTEGYGFWGSVGLKYEL
ncbi:TonB-dependent receptor [Zobellia alginiliquefaciens]|uniref:TonB-dependent receptor n=1 Tax=Zobellia alginiliquefaciens TaxID=3032586 RepID=UPI0023E22E76|nr:TonB-dependent receptor [Zobellia alginiliquefaciens]